MCIRDRWTSVTSDHPHVLEYLCADLHHGVLGLTCPAPAWIIPDLSLERCNVHTDRLALLVHSIEGLLNEWISQVDLRVWDLQVVSHLLDVRRGDIHHGLSALKLRLVAGIHADRLVDDLVLEVLLRSHTTNDELSLILDGLLVQADAVRVSELADHVLILSGHAVQRRAVVLEVHVLTEEIPQPTLIQSGSDCLLGNLPELGRRDGSTKLCSHLLDLN